MNMGQLVMLLRAKYLVDAQGYNKIQGSPSSNPKSKQKIEEILELRPRLYSRAEPKGICARKETNDHGIAFQY